MPDGEFFVGKEFLLTEEDFQYLTNMVHETTGIVLKNDKRELVYGRLARRLRELNLKTFKQYCEIIKSDGGVEAVNFINAITTNVTHFFREIHHFEFLEKVFIPKIIKSRMKDYQPKLRIWSAGCSSGNEPYSIAMVLKENIPNLEQWDVKILATDLDSNVLEAAYTGLYPVSSLQTVSDNRKLRWFKNGYGENEGVVKISKDLKKIINYKKLNLMDNWPMKGLFDVIFCRNVAIYFDNETRAKIIDRFADNLVEGGYLIVGHSETLFGVTNRFESVGKTIYKKIT